MLESCTKKYTDESSEHAFRFTFYCDRCGAPHQSPPVAFSNGEPRGSDDAKKLWKMRWQKEHTLAFERANHEARHYYFCCPGCGEYVCTNCISSENLASGDIRDLCLNCSRKLSRKGGAPLQMISPSESQTHIDAQEKQAEAKGWRLWKKIRGSPRSPDE